MEEQLAPYLEEEGCIRLIQCFLDPELMLCHPESPKSLWDPWSYRAERDENKIDHLFELFTNQKIGMYVGKCQVYYEKLAAATF